MPYARSNGARIRYAVDGRGPTVLLHHGFSDGLETWEEQGWVGALAPRFRLIRMDARGHGESSKPHEPSSYAMARRVEDCLAVLDAVGARTAAFVGYSLGGRVGYELVGAAPHRITAAVLGGAHPFAQSMEPIRAAIAAGVGSWVDHVDAALPHGLREATRRRLLRNDPKALQASVAADRPDRTALLDGWRIPTLLLVGDRDPLAPAVAAAADRIPRARLVRVPERGHLDLALGLDPARPAVLRFFDDAPGAQPRSDGFHPPMRPAPAQAIRAGLWTTMAAFRALYCHLWRSHAILRATVVNPPPPDGTRHG